jgi:hypothetical protein
MRPHEVLPCEPSGRAELDGAVSRRSHAATSKDRLGSVGRWSTLTWRLEVVGAFFALFGKGGLQTLYTRRFYDRLSFPTPGQPVSLARSATRSARVERNWPVSTRLFYLRNTLQKEALLGSLKLNSKFCNGSEDIVDTWQVGMIAGNGPLYSRKNSRQIRNTTISRCRG